MSDVPDIGTNPIKKIDEFIKRNQPTTEIDIGLLEDELKEKNDRIREAETRMIEKAMNPGDNDEDNEEDNDDKEVLLIEDIAHDDSINPILSEEQRELVNLTEKIDAIEHAKMMESQQSTLTGEVSEPIPYDDIDVVMNNDNFMEDTSLLKYIDTPV